MKTKLFRQTRRDDRTTAQEAAERYYAEHPGTPSACNNREFTMRRQICGFGSSSISSGFWIRQLVASALRSFVISYPFRGERANGLPAVRFARRER